MRIVDVHHHCFPTNAKIKPWNIMEDELMMNKVKVDEVILSCPLRVDSLSANEYNSFIWKNCETSKRYHMLACLGYDDIELSLIEIEKYKDKAVGFALNTHNYDIYLGDNHINPLLDKLNQIEAIVVVHPNHFRASANQKVVFTGNDSVYEYTFDTARAMFDLVLQGKIKRWPNIKWVLPHAGGVIPFLAHRVSVSSLWGCTDMSEVEIMEDLKSFYYDLALNHSKCNYQFMKSFVSVSRLLYGTDYPNSGDVLLERDLNYFLNEDVFTNEEKEIILHENAERLFKLY